MSGFRAVWAGLRGSYENLFRYIVAGALWWLCVLLVLPAPAGTLALFRATDPRWGLGEDPPAWRELFHFLTGRLWSAWTLALLTAPILLLIAFNLLFYVNDTSALAVLAPVWLFLMVLGMCISTVAFAVASVRQQPALGTLRLALAITGTRLLPVLIAFACCFAIALVAFVLTPLVIVLPAVIAAIVNRLVFGALRIEIPNPTAPTPEREIEKQRAER